MKRTKIVSTLGPSSSSIEIIEDLIEKGVNIFRLNFSHGTHQDHLEILKNVRIATDNKNKFIGTLQDICGPKVRVLPFKTGKLSLQKNDLLRISKQKITENEDNGILLEDNDVKTYQIWINNPYVLNNLKENDRIFFADGTIFTETVEINSDYVVVKVNSSCELKSNKGINFPDTSIDIEVLTDKDKLDIEWGVINEVSFIAISFVQNSQDIIKAKKLIDEFMLKHHKENRPKVIAKIEKFDAFQNIDSIIEVSDAIMIARGDLGIEIPFEKVPFAQKKIINKANLAGKPVIVATQMMLSMVENEMATRAEISDVFNAVLDGTDAVMLSEESAVGKHPVKVVEALTKTILEAELNLYKYETIDNVTEDIEAVAHMIVKLANEMNCNGIINFTLSGGTTAKLSKYRPIVPIIAICHTKYIAQQLALYWGVEVLDIYNTMDTNKLIVKFVKENLDNGNISRNKKYVIAAGYPAGIQGNINFIRILKNSDMEFFYNQGE